LVAATRQACGIAQTTYARLQPCTPCGAATQRWTGMTEHDVQDLIAAVTIAQTEWVNGVVNPLWDLREGTIFGPFGGPAGGGPGLDEAQSRIAALFHDGSAELDIA